MGRRDQDVHFLASKEEDGSGWILHQPGFTGCERAGFPSEKMQQQPESVC